MAIGTPLLLGSHNSAAATTNALTTATNDCPVGSLIVVFAAYSTVADTVSGVTDSAGNTYVVLDNFVGTGIGVAICYCVNSAFDLPVGGTITVTFGGATASSISAVTVPNAATASPVDKHAITDSGLAATTTNAMSTGVLAQADSIIFNLVGTAAGPGVTTASAGFTKIAGLSGTPTVFPEYKIVASTVSTSCTPTWGTANNYAADMVVFKGVSPVTAGEMAAASQEIEAYHRIEPPIHVPY